MSFLHKQRAEHSTISTTATQPDVQDDTFEFTRQRAMSALNHASRVKSVMQLQRVVGNTRVIQMMRGRREQDKDQASFDQQNMTVECDADAESIKRQGVGWPGPLDRLLPTLPAPPTVPVPAECLPGFCSPLPSKRMAAQMRDVMMPVLLAGIDVAVDPRVVPLWRMHLSGGSTPVNLSGQFGADFTRSPTTIKTTNYLVGELQAALKATPPVFPAGSKTVKLDIATLIPAAIAAIDDPSSANQMNFNQIHDIGGNLAGGIGKDQTTYPVGATPSPFNDERLVEGTVTITEIAPGVLQAETDLTFTVKDTIDLCPGNCGALKEQAATIPISQFEATGISGDVPFSIEFKAPKQTFSL